MSADACLQLPMKKTISGEAVCGGRAGAVHCDNDIWGGDSVAKPLSSFVAPRRLADEMGLNDSEGSVPSRRRRRLPRTWHAEVR